MLHHKFQDEPTGVRPDYVVKLMAGVTAAPRLT